MKSLLTIFESQPNGVADFEHIAAFELDVCGYNPSIGPVGPKRLATASTQTRFSHLDKVPIDELDERELHPNVLLLMGGATLEDGHQETAWAEDADQVFEEAYSDHVTVGPRFALDNDEDMESVGPTDALTAWLLERYPQYMGVREKSRPNVIVIRIGSESTTKAPTVTQHLISFQSIKAAPDEDEDVILPFQIGRGKYRELTVRYR